MNRVLKEKFDLHCGKNLSVRIQWHKSIEEKLTVLNL